VRASLTGVRAFLSITALAIALSGCAVRIASNTNTGATAASARITTTSPVATTTVVGVMAAGAVHYYTMGPDGKQPMYGAPDPDPTRTINAQDCTQPVDPDAGNLMCR
jgi:hypothetical protein